jgi:hypothetical protein
MFFPRHLTFYPAHRGSKFVRNVSSDVFQSVHRLRHCATSWKVAGSRPDEVNYFFSIYLILPAALGPGVYSASDINEYQKQKNNVSGE